MSRDDQPILEVDQVALRFGRRLGSSLRLGLCDTLRDLAGLPPRTHLGKDEFWALDGVSFQLRRGEALGLLGANGAGKSSLLKVVAGLLKPDRGRVTVRGRVGALIELGAGMHPLLTGRENIRVNAAILGLTRRETDAKIDEIIAFADLGDFIDAPVRGYSSGMRVRLGFAVAAHLEPDLLLIDEVLAVGDVSFRMKCFNRLRQIQSRTAFILVTHSVPDVTQFCTSGAFLKGGICSLGSVEQIASLYSPVISEGFAKFEAITHLPIHSPSHIESHAGEIRLPLAFARPPAPGSKLHFGIKTDQGFWVTGTQIQIDTPAPRGTVITSCPLSPGAYVIVVGLENAAGKYEYYAPAHSQLIVQGSSYKQAGPIKTLVRFDVSIPSQDHDS